jgi:hypothetical protein
VTRRRQSSPTSRLPGYEDKDARCDFFKSWLLPGARTADPRRFIDFTILDELEREGFLKTLYKKN